MTPLETPPRTVPGAFQAPSETALQGPKNLGFPFVFKGKRKIRRPPLPPKWRDYPSPGPPPWIWPAASTLRTLSLSVIHFKK